jgi:hypothetical protein
MYLGLSSAAQAACGEAMHEFAKKNIEAEEQMKLDRVR